MRRKLRDLRTPAFFFHTATEKVLNACTSQHQLHSRKSLRPRRNQISPVSRFVRIILNTLDARARFSATLSAATHLFTALLLASPATSRERCAADLKRSNSHGGIGPRALKASPRRVTRLALSRGRLRRRRDCSTGYLGVEGKTVIVHLSSASGGTRAACGILGPV